MHLTKNGDYPSPGNAAAGHTPFETQGPLPKSCQGNLTLILPFCGYHSTYRGDRTHPKVATRKRVCLLTPSQLQQDKENLHLENPPQSHTVF